jgi:sigma-B regulation protein RsbU (phosphoserine phosphatase)
MSSQYKPTNQFALGGSVGDAWEIKSQPAPTGLQESPNSIEPSCETFLTEKGNDTTEGIQHLPENFQNRRITRLFQLMRELQDSRAPADTLWAVQKGLTDVRGFVAWLLLSTRELSDGHYRVVLAQLNDEWQSERQNGARWELGPVRCGGILGEIIARGEPQLVKDVDWARDPFVSDQLREYSSIFAIPLVGDRLPVTWAIALKRSTEEFTTSDLEEIVERVALVSALLENQVLAGELAQANERIDRDARQVGELQRTLLPAALPRIAGLEIAASYEPLGRAGGDLYDFFPLHEGPDANAANEATPTRWCLFIGDVAGHGLATAVVMAIAQAVLHAHPALSAGPASLFMHANRQLCCKRIGDFMTGFLGIYEPDSRRLIYATAGHPPPLLRRAADGSIRALDAVEAYPLGIDESEIYKEAIVQFRQGDTLLLYTDGITEAGGAQDLFGIERLTREFRVGGDRPAELINRLQQAVRTHTGNQAARDDQTLVAVRIL